MSKMSSVGGAPTQQQHQRPKSPQREDLHHKAEEINLVLLQPDVDLWKLRELALSDGGLVNGKFDLCRYSWVYI